MTRCVLFLSAALLALPLASRAQTTAATPTPASQSQLDRIESKLDAVLRRLDQLQRLPPGAVQGHPVSSGASSSSPVSGEPPAPPPAAYKAGALVIARPAPKDANSLAEVPADDVGGFVYAGGPVALTDIRTRGVRYAGPVAAEIQGWLRAREAGRYQIGTDLEVHFRTGFYFAPTCLLQAWLEGRSLDQRSILISHPAGNDANATLVLGAELQPGLYRLRLWTACTAPQGVAITSELLLKAPSELNLRPVTGGDLLHREE